MVPTIVITSYFPTISNYASKVDPDLFEIYELIYIGKDLIFIKTLSYQVSILCILNNCFSVVIVWGNWYFSEVSPIYDPLSSTNNPSKDSLSY